jgi:hypothetical protein
MRKPIWETFAHEIWVERIENGTEALILVSQSVMVIDSKSLVSTQQE